MAVEKQNKNGRLKLKQDLAKGSFETPVSYTHLTLPTT